jgi:putative ABC transport system permease protein
MRALDRKLLRDLRRHWTQVLSIAAVMACGAMTIMGLRSTMTSIQRARDAYFAEYRFADLFATVQRAPASVAARLAEIEGVGAVETRVVRDVALHVPGIEQSVTGHAVSIPETRRPMLNELHLRRGRWIAPGADDEILVSERFAETNHIVPGDTLGAVLNGRWRRFRVAGIALSPEFVIEIGGGGFFLDNRRYGIIWASRRSLEAVFDMKNAFNDVIVRLAPGSDVRRVTDAIDRELLPWGSAGTYDRSEQASARVLSDEFAQLRTNATIFPTFFLIVGAFLLNVVLSRLIASQRDEIAALKAFGYTNREIGAHYLAFAFGAVSLGAVAGIAGGVWMGRAFTELYMNYFRFPALTPVVDWTGAALGIGVSGGFALLGAFSSVRRATRLPPAEALRPETPAKYRPLLVERLGLGRFVSPSVRMVLRNLERRPVRTLSSVVGVALAFALLAAGRYPYDALDRMMDLQFRAAQRGDFTVIFTTAQPERAVNQLAALRGVTHAEPFRSTGVRIRARGVSKTTAITSVLSTGTLRRLVDVHGNSYDVPVAGAVFSASLARALALHPGDTAAVELLEQGSALRSLVVAGTIDEMFGQGIYMDEQSLSRLLREGRSVSGAYLSIDAGSETAVFEQLKELPAVNTAISRSAIIHNVEEQNRESVRLVLSIIIGSACLIAMGVVYNGARISLSERGRELASLRVLGFTRSEVGGLLLGEQAAVTALALPVGALVGLLFSALLAAAFKSDRYEFPFVAKAASYVFSGAVVVGAAVFASLIVRRRIDRLDLVAVLKTRE